MNAPQGGITIPVAFTPGPCAMRVEKVEVNGLPAYLVIASTLGATQGLFYDEPSFDNMLVIFNRVRYGGLEVPKTADVIDLLKPRGNGQHGP